MKYIVINLLAWIALLAALVFIFAHFYNGTIDLTIGEEQKFVVFKPPHSLEIGIICLVLCILLFLIYGYLERNEKQVQQKRDREAALLWTPDEKMSKLIEGSLHFSGSYEEGKIRMFYEEVAKPFQEYKIIQTDTFSYTGANVELRGKYKDFAVRLKFSYLNELQLMIKADIFNAYLEIYKNSGLFSAEKARDCIPEYLETYISDYAKSYSLIFLLYYNPDKIPVHKNDKDPWNKEDVLRVFVGKGIYIEGFEDGLNLYMAVYNAFSEDFRSELLSFMFENKISNIQITQDEIVMAIPPDQLLLKPLTLSYQGLDFLLRIFGEFETVPVTGKINLATEETKNGLRARLNTCNYCSTKYPLINDCSCPNCGAPYS